MENTVELLALSGKRNPRPGKLGIVQQVALADLPVVEGSRSLVTILKPMLGSAIMLTSSSAA